MLILCISSNNHIRCEELEEVARVWERELNELRNFSFLEKELLETEIAQMKEGKEKVTITSLLKIRLAFS